MHQLLDALSQLNILHTIWVVKAGFTEEELQAEKYSINWLESEWGDLQAEPLQYSSHHSLTQKLIPSQKPYVTLKLWNQSHETYTIASSNNIYSRKSIQL